MIKRTHLTYEERKTIENMLDLNKETKEIAAKINRNSYTVLTEIKRGGGSRHYTAEKGQEIYEELMKTKSAKLTSPFKLLQMRVEKLEAAIKFLNSHIENLEKAYVDR